MTATGTVAHTSATSQGCSQKDAVLLCRLLVTLLYLRQPWTMQGIAEVVDCAESTVCNYIHEILPYLWQELPEGTSIN